MAEPEIDYKAVFQALPGAVALLTPQLIYADVNEEWLRILGRAREQEIGHYLPDDFASSPNSSGAAVVRNLQASLRRVADTGECDAMEVQRFEPEGPYRPAVRDDDQPEAHSRPATVDARYWSMTNIPVFDSNGQLVLLLHRAEEVTELIQARAVALSLQEAMLPTHRPTGRHPVAVRYRPAGSALDVGGDWYDLVDLPGDRLGIAVGDVVGHGLSAAGVMGQLRSALSAASRVASGPARALEVLDRYARSVTGAENATAANTFVDWNAHAIAYSSAGHLPPALLHGDGAVEFLDQATHPPLGARLEDDAWPQSTIGFTEDAFLVLYTDGLVERRREDIDTGIARLADCLTQHERAADAEALADALLADLLPPEGVTDDTALVIVRL
ncbi:PP2C family protein-serine/threonine phosphatase [Streptomyces sp. NPDC004096]|uniref:PP2C family protein-serine/threonine phosphatase n=1 Tax=unclassified Streptomyces TaxID=2593676 RepID=UPI0033AC0FC7